jgi:hypothetical protein
MRAIQTSMQSESVKLNGVCNCACGSSFHRNPSSPVCLLSPLSLLPERLEFFMSGLRESTGHVTPVRLHICSWTCGGKLSFESDCSRQTDTNILSFQKCSRLDGGAGALSVITLDFYILLLLKESSYSTGLCHRLGFHFIPAPCSSSGCQLLYTLWWDCRPLCWLSSHISLTEYCTVIRLPPNIARALCSRNQSSDGPSRWSHFCH